MILLVVLPQYYHTSGPECTIDMCAGINCGNGTCIGGTCSCDPNYVEIDNFCERTCAPLNPCQELDIFLLPKLGV